MNKTTIVKIALVLCIGIPIVLVLGLATGFAAENGPLPMVWPGFFVVLLFIIGKESSLRGLAQIALGGLVAVWYAWAGNQLIGFLLNQLHLHQWAAVGLGVCVGVFVYGALMAPLPWAFNNYGFLYYLVAAAFAEAKPVQWSGAVIVVGALFAVLIFGGIKLLCGFSPIKLSFLEEEPAAVKE
ncbi:MAG: hypothetical protein LBG60_07470 [Bifidobacteriaceae bacterium]|nr:hypothetical protein [Bifidobacteriaceae bacterium]